jgi:NAD(P)-dependent dehydrogenase (short-subunit alcohol dehydrogenase family)
MRFADRVVIVTGAAGGIGRVMAGRFAAEGARVVVADRRGDAAQEVASEIGGWAIATTTDVTVSADVDAMVAAAEDAFDRVDVLVNNAAVCEGDDMASDDSAWISGAVLRVDGGLMSGYPLMAEELLVESRDADGA